MQRNRPGIVLLLFAGASLVLILLAGGMAGIPFDAARTFTVQSPDEGLVLPMARIDQRVLAFFYLILVAAAVFIMIIDWEGRRRALLTLALVGVMALGLYTLFRGRSAELAVSPTPPGTAQATPSSTEIAPTPFPVNIETGTLPDSPEWLVTAIGAALAFMLAGAAGLLYLALSQRLRPKTLPDHLAQAAELAAEAIQSGEEIRDVIMRCYDHMTRRLAEERNLTRGGAVTPREFEQTLAGLGFPHDPVRTLTGLFEAVRYGHIEASPEQTRQALDSLQAIVTYVRGLNLR
jgi:hypothetical protein